jgi:Domain of unknown function (DUF4148)
MNTKQLLLPLFTAAVALIGFASTTAAHANEVSYEAPVTWQSTLTRAEVRAEAARARAAGEFSLSDETYVPKVAFMPKTRAQVHAETLEAIRLGLTRNGEDTVLPTVEQLSRVEMAGLRALSMTLAAR